MRILFGFLLMILLFDGELANASDTQSFVVIAAPGEVRGPLTRETLAQIFSRKLNFWSDGARIHPVNLPANNPLRAIFSQVILGRAPDQFDSYWRERYFHGVLPPHVVESEEAVLLFVRTTPGAIGYVSNCIPLGEIDVVMTFGTLPHCTR